MEQKELLLGLDDAGRGPLIGPMLLAGVLIDKEIEKEFKELGVADSKVLTPKKRKRLSQIIMEKAISFDSQSATPAEIDTGMGIGLNLNQVEAMEAGVVINNITSKLSQEEKKALKIVIDCPSNNPEGWKKQLMEYVKVEGLTIACEHKADRDHVSVAAASILAKVERDEKIEKLKEKIGLDFGSGYPSDPKTKDFLRKHVNDFKEERIFRETWATFQTAKQKFSQRTLPDY